MTEVTWAGTATTLPRDASSQPRRLGAALRRLNVASTLVGVLTLVVVAVGMVDQHRDGQLGSALASGRAELVAPMLIGLIVIAFVCEQLWPAERHRLFARGHVQDALFLLLYVAITVPVMTMLSIGFAQLLGPHLGWLEVGWTASWPTWLLVAVTLVAMDGANWLAHYADHRLEPLWRLHAVHHSQEELSVLTSFRAHPLVHTTGFLLATIPVLALMGDRSIAPVLITGYVCLGTLPHANVRWTFGPLGRVIVSPAYHRLHHSSTGVDGMNLGVALTIWDVLARRAQFPDRTATACRTGLAGRPLEVEQTAPKSRPLGLLGRQLVEPFTSARS